MPANGDQFTCVVAEKFYQCCCNPGEPVALESHVFIHAIDPLKQMTGQIYREIAQYMWNFTHVIIMPSLMHIWEIMERGQGKETIKNIGELTHNYVYLAGHLMRQGLTAEVLLMQYLPFGPISCLVPKIDWTKVWEQLVMHCNRNNNNIKLMLKHLWARENDLGTMNVPHFVTWGFAPEDPQSAWDQ